MPIRKRWLRQRLLDLRRREALLAGQPIPQRYMQQWRLGGRNAWQHEHWMGPYLDEVEGA